MGFQEEIANALERVLGSRKRNDGNVIHSSEISKEDRQLLVKANWLQPIIRGWYMTVKPEILPGESSIWYANFWKFVSAYLNHRFGIDYCLSAESSIDLHTASSTVPHQVTVVVAKGGSLAVDLPFETSILPYRDPKNLPEERMEIEGILVMELGYALCKVPPIFFEKEPQKAEIALRLIRSADELLGPIIRHGFRKAAARLIGAYRFLDDQSMVEHLQMGLENVAVTIKSENPFIHTKRLTNIRVRSPYAARIFSLWEEYRGVIVDHFPAPVDMTQDKDQYLHHMEDIYKLDAYNSLSIEGFEVDEELVERIRDHQWNPDQLPRDSEARNALAARGYYEAFQEVKKTIADILNGGNAGEILEKDLAKWYLSLFASSVRAGILQTTDLLGYRKSQVYIRTSRHIPLPKEALMDAMEAFFICLKQESHAGVRAILGHFIFVYIHPYIDGNGRIGRFIMNAMLASGGYPWTIVHVKHRAEYLSALEGASVDHNIKPFVRFIAREMKAKS